MDFAPNNNTKIRKSSHEIDFIIKCLRSLLGHPLNKETLTSLLKKINWTEFQKQLIQHRVLPLVFSYINDHDLFHYVDDEIAHQIREQYSRIAKNNLAFSGILLRILSILKKEEITTIPIKGPALAEELYGDVTYRTFSDLDILVSKVEAFKAYQILILNGLRPELNLSYDQFLKYQQTEDHIILYTNRNDVAVELHWELSDRYLSVCFDLSLVTANLTYTILLDKKVYCFSKEDLLVYLCVHGSKHSWYNLESIFLVARILTDNENLDWNRVLHLSDAIHCRTKLLLGIHLAETFFMVPVPERIKIHLKRDRNKILNLSSYIISIIYQENKKTWWAKNKSKFTFYQIKAMDRLKDKVRYIFFVLIFPTNFDWIAVSLPTKFSFLYYFFRPFRLILNAIKLTRKKERQVK